MTQANFSLPDDLLSEMAAAVHLGATLPDGPGDLSELARRAIRHELDRLADELHGGKPWDVELGARLRAGRRRRRTGP